MLFLIIVVIVNHINCTLSLWLLTLIYFSRPLLYNLSLLPLLGGREKDSENVAVVVNFDKRELA